MDNLKDSIYAKALNPYTQCGIVLLCFVGILLISKLAVLVGMSTSDPTMAWTLAATFLLFFVLFNSVFSLSAKNDNAYWTKSFISFIGYAVLSAALAYFIAGLAIEEIGAYKWIYIVISFVYLVFISIIGFMKRIVEFAQKEEWTKPMRRSKKRR